MPRNGSGTSSVINNFVIDTIADPDEVNANFTDVADQLTNSLPRDGQAGMNAPLPLQNGTVALPALTFTSDPDTGIYRKGANQIGWAEGGVDVTPNRGTVYSAKAANYTALGSDNNAIIRFTAAATLSLTAAATLATNWHMTVIADGGDVTIDPNGAETIDGAATLVIYNGYSAEIVCNGSAFFTDKMATTLKALVVSAPAGHLYGLTLSNNASDATNDIDIATGSAASDAASPVMMTLASALTKRIDANWAVGTNQGGLDTGAVADGTYWIWLIQRSDTGVVDALVSASATSPTMPASYDRKRRIAPIIRASASILGFSYNSLSKFWEFTASTTDTSTINTTATLRTVKVPVGAAVMGRFGAFLANTGGLMSIANHWNPALGSSLPNGRSGVGNVFINSAVSQSMSYNFDTVTNSSAQIYNLATTSGGSTLTSYALTTLGYFFTPGS